ncbi:MAG: hypothetical protein QXK74_08140 [Candidatus Nitrosocaldaceae archaeon]
MNPRPSAYKAYESTSIDISNMLLSFISSTSKKDDFLKYLMQRVNPRLASRYMREAVRYAEYAIKQTDINDAPRLYLKKYENPNSYNNALKPILHLYRFLGLQIPEELKLKRISTDRLIIAPSYEQVIEGLRQLKNENDIDLIRFYLLCSTTLLRPQFIVTLSSFNIDLDNRLINVKVDRKTKHYRSQIIHKALIPYMASITSTHIFKHRYDYYQKKIRKITNINPSQLRDFTYNAMLKAGMNPILVEWLMGHSIGVAAHYLADSIREEYAKFESLYPFAV